MYRAAGLLSRLRPAQVCEVKTGLLLTKASLHTHRWQDRILLRGMTFFGHHGVLPEETRLGQRFVVDATLFCDLQAAGASDDLQDTVNYADVFSQIQDRVEGKSFQLLECLAETVAGDIIAAHPRVEAVQLAIRKPHVAVSGTLESLGVEILRSR